MTGQLLLLIAEAITVYFLVLWAHSLRNRYGLAHFYALLGGLTAVMSWITDAGVKVSLPHISLMVGSSVFYTALLLGVFVVYVFDGPQATRIAISTVAGVSTIVPLIALLLHVQAGLSGSAPLVSVPMPSLRINTASVLTTVADFLFLAIAWEFLGKPRLQLPLWLRAFLTLLGVMWLDVILFSTGAFLGTPPYLEIMTGTFLSRLLISLFAFPFLYLYLAQQNKKFGVVIEHRPVLAILKEVTEVREELSLAQKEIERRIQVEREKGRPDQGTSKGLGRGQDLARHSADLRLLQEYPRRSRRLASTRRIHPDPQRSEIQPRDLSRLPQAALSPRTLETVK